MHTKKLVFPLLVLLLSPMALWGCAALTVDVDVYKGPLANNKNVQTEQLATMAVGAQPLLERVKNSLDDEEGQNELLEIVEDILRLYEDNGEVAYDSNLGRLVRKGRALLSEYSSAWETLNNRHALDQELAQKLRDSEDSANASIIDNGDIVDLRNAYLGFLTGRASPNHIRNSRNLVRAQVEFYERNKNRALELGRPAPDATLQDWVKTYYDATKEGQNRLGSGANVAYDYLANNESLIRSDARLLTGDHVLQEQLVRRTMAIANSYLAARRSAEALFLLAMFALREGSTIEIPTEEHRLSLRKAVCNFATKLIDNDLLDMSLQLVVEKQSRAAKEEFADAFERKRNAPLALGSMDDDEALVETLMANPVQGATALCALHAALKRVPEELNHPERGVYDQNRRAYGLVIGPIEEQPADELEALYAKIEASAGGALSRRGRVENGLFTTIEAYLNASSVPNPDTTRVEDTRRVLLLELERFAEKLLFIANHESFFEHRRSSAGGVTRRGTDARPATASSGMSDKELFSYVQILQAVGNQILVLANELTVREAHEAGQTQGHPRERRAIRINYGGNAAQMFDEMANAIAARSRFAGMDDAAITLARKPVDEALTKAQTALKEAQDARDKGHPPAQGNTTPGVSDLETATKARALLERDRSADSESIRYKLHAYLVKLDAEWAKLKESDSTAARPPHKLKEWYLGNLGAPKEEALLLKLVEKTTPGEGEPAEAYLQLLADKLDKEIRNARDSASTGAREAQARAEKLAELDAAVDAAREEVALRKKAVQDIEAEVALAGKAKAASEAIAARRADTLSAITNRTNTPSPEQVKDELIAQIQANMADGSDTRKFAVELIGEYRPRLDMLEIDQSEAKTQKEVLDDVIAALRQEHLKVVREAGEGSPEALKVKAALDLAYEQRGGMVYIRSANAYLRSSYISTTLQGSPSLAWNNMLARHATKMVPLLGNMVNNPPKWRRQIQEEIDKQYWQSINQVRVAGGGRTLKVLVKDDVGNWYVKGFSADPEDIIKSASNLAMFNLGASMGTNLMAEYQAAALEESGAKSEADLLKAQTKMSLARGPLHDVHAHYLQRYLEKTEADLKTVQGQLAEGGVDAQVKSNWAAITYMDQMPDFKADLEAALKQSVEAHLKPAREAVKSKEAEDAAKTRSLLSRAAKNAATPELAATVELALAAAKTAEEQAKDRKKASQPGYVPDTGERILAGMQAMRAFANDLNRRVLAIMPKEAVTANEKWAKAKRALEDAQTKVVEQEQKVAELRASLAAEEEAEAREELRKEIDAAQDELSTRIGTREAAEAVVADTGLAVSQYNAAAQSAKAEMMTILAKLTASVTARLETVRIYEQGIVSLGESIAN